MKKARRHVRDRHARSIGEVSRPTLLVALLLERLKDNHQRPAVSPRLECCSGTPSALPVKQ